MHAYAYVCMQLATVSQELARTAAVMQVLLVPGRHSCNRIYSRKCDMFEGLQKVPCSISTD
jgi:hypothetical protein